MGNAGTEVMGGQRCQLRAGRNGGFGEAVLEAEGFQGKKLGSRPSGFVKRGAGSSGWEDGDGWMHEALIEAFVGVIYGLNE